MQRVRISALLALSLAACSGEGQTDSLPPTDRFYFPAGLATSRVTRVTPGDTTALLVTSTNFDLRYSARSGGTLLSVDPVASKDTVGFTPLGVERIASYAGPIVVADATTCPGIAQPAVITASRFNDAIYRFGLATDGSLRCDAGCERVVGGPLKDPLGVAIACLPAAAPDREAGPRRAEYVGWLAPPTSTVGFGPGGWITELDLDDPTGPARSIEVGDGPIRAIAYDPDADRLWLASNASGARALLYSVLLADPGWRGATPWEAVDSANLYPAVRGLELVSIAVGSPVSGTPQRLYATGRLYDAEYQDANGVRPAGDVGGVLLVLDVTTGSDGRPVVQVHRTVSIGAGVGEVALVRAGSGKRDVVLATVVDGGLLFVYDDETESVAQVVGHDALGQPLLGDRPMALAVDQPAAGGPAEVYVASFGWHVVTHFQLLPGSPAGALSLDRIGGLAP